MEIKKNDKQVMVSDLKVGKNTFEMELLNKEELPKDKFISPAESGSRGDECFEINYNVEDLISLKDFLDNNNRKLSFDDLLQIFIRIDEIYRVADNYLIENESICINSDYMFIDPKKDDFSKIKVLFVPYGKFNYESNMRDFINGLGQYIDSKDKDCVNLYKRINNITKDDISMDTIMDAVNFCANYVGYNLNTGDCVINLTTYEKDFLLNELIGNEDIEKNWDTYCDEYKSILQKLGYEHEENQNNKHKKINKNKGM